MHELVHVYDHCRAANLDWNNCEHHACSEVRTLEGCQSSRFAVLPHCQLWMNDVRAPHIQRCLHTLEDSRASKVLRLCRRASNEERNMREHHARYGFADD